MSDKPTPFLLIARACDADLDGACLEIKAACGKEPTQETLEKTREALVTMFTESIGEAPTRVAVIVLPWNADQDEGDPRAAARDLLASLRRCAEEGDDLADIEVDGQLAKHPWLAS